MSTYKNRSRDKGNINSDYIRATQTGVNAVNASKLSASNLIPNYPIKTDNLNVLQSTKLSISDTNGLQNALDNAGGIQYNGTIPAPVGNLVKINDVDGNVEDSNITEAVVNGKLDKAGDTMTGNLNLGSNDIDSVGNIEAVSLDGLQIVAGTNAQDLDLNNIGFNIKIPNCNLDLNNNSIENVNTLDVDNLTTSTFAIQSQNDINLLNNNILGVNNLRINSLDGNTTSTISVNNDLSLSNNDIQNINLLECNLLGKNGAGDIRLQDNIDVNNNDLKFVSNIDATDIKTTTLTAYAPLTEITLSANTDLNLNGNNIIGLELIDGLQPSGGLYSKVDSNTFPIPPATLPQAEIDILSVGTDFGNRTIPEDTFKAGSLFSLKIGGSLTCSNGDQFTIKVATNCNTGDPARPQADLCSQVVQVDGNQTNAYYELEIDFAVRSIGVAGTASMLTNGSFDYFNNNNVKKGYGFNQLQNTIFSTEVVNELCILYSSSDVDAFTIDVASITKFY